MKFIIIILFFAFVSFESMAQKSKPFFTNRLTKKYHVLINTSFITGGVCRHEAALMYIYGNRLKIHLVYKDNYVDKDITFVLSGNQVEKIDRLEIGVRSEKVKAGETVYASTIGRIEMLFRMRKSFLCE